MMISYLMIILIASIFVKQLQVVLLLDLGEPLEEGAFLQLLLLSGR